MSFDDLITQTTTDTVRAAASVRAKEMLNEILSSLAIRNDSELEAATLSIDELISRTTLLNAESDYLEVLELLVSKYENEHSRPAQLPDHEVLAHLMQERGLTLSALERETGIAHSTIADILSGHRRLNRAHIEVLAKSFHVSPETFRYDLD